MMDLTALPPMRACRRVAAAWLAFPLAAAGAQDPSARFVGSVVDAANGAPVAGARIALLGTSRFVSSDTGGRFDFARLPAGINRFLVFKEGFPRTTLALAFAAGEVLERRLELDSSKVVAEGPAVAPQPVAGVTISAARPVDRRYEEFERRRRIGRGQYVTRAEIEARAYNNLIDALRPMRGVVIECGGGGGCFARMARATRGCLPQYVIDDRPQDYFALSMAIRDIEGVEVYAGAADVPGEYAGVSAGCGVIVVWTRNGPPRRSPESRR